MKFGNEVDHRHVLFEGLWLVAYHYLLLQKWCLLFKPVDEMIQKIAVWVQVPNLSIDLYNPKFFVESSDFVVNHVKIDNVRSISGRFACMCVEMDLRRKLVHNFVALC